MSFPSRGAALAILAVLAVVAYLPLVNQPLVEDDYANIQIARDAGAGIVSNPIFGVRSTGFLMMSVIHSVFGMKAVAYYAAMILLHILNTWLVYAIGQWREIGYQVSLWAAASFAVAEGHQEAVMWLSADWEQMQFLFGVGSCVCWLMYLYRERWSWLAISLGAFAVALCSKESAVILLPLMALPFLFGRSLRKRWWALAPFAVLVALDLVRIAITRTYSFRFNDGSFSLGAPFWLTWPLSFGRLFWFWGILAAIALLLWRPPNYAKVLMIGCAWAGMAIVPYSFLTYSTRIPSRQTYLASVGVALIVGCAFQALMNSGRRRWLVAALATVFVVHNVGYLWTKKRTEFLKRAAPTEQLIELVRKTDGPVYVRCFPRPPIVANSAVEMTTGRKDLIWDAAQSGAARATFCY